MYHGRSTVLQHRPRRCGPSREDHQGAVSAPTRWTGREESSLGRLMETYDGLLGDQTRPKAHNGTGPQFLLTPPCLTTRYMGCFHWRIGSGAIHRETLRTVYRGGGVNPALNSEAVKTQFRRGGHGGTPLDDPLHQQSLVET